MNQKLIQLSRRYVRALRHHLKRGSRASLPAALGLGRQAVALGLETLGLSRIHAQALAVLKLSRCKNRLTRRAEIFFARASALIEETHRAARQTKARLSRLKPTLGRRKVREAAARKSGRHHHQSLEESLELQTLLRRLTHRALAAQEAERTKISHGLQDEIAQTLLGINVRLLTLKQAALGKPREIKNQIASTRRLVLKSAQSVRQFARELNRQNFNQA